MDGHGTPRQETVFRRAEARLAFYPIIVFAFLLVEMTLIYLVILAPGKNEHVSFPLVLVIALVHLGLGLYRYNFGAGIRCPKCHGQVLHVAWQGEKPLLSGVFRQPVLTPRPLCRFCGFDLRQHPEAQPAPAHTHGASCDHGAERGGETEAAKPDEAAMRRQIWSSWRRMMAVRLLELASIALSYWLVQVDWALAVVPVMTFSLWYADRLRSGALQDEETLVCPKCEARLQKGLMAPETAKYIYPPAMIPLFDCSKCGHRLDKG